MLCAPYLAHTELEKHICDRQKGASTLKTVGKQNANKFNYSQWHIYGEYNAAINNYKPTQTAL